MIVRERERTEQRKNTTLRRIVTAARVDETDRIRETISVATLKFCKNKNRGKLHGHWGKVEMLRLVRRLNLQLLRQL